MKRLLFSLMLICSYFVVIGQSDTKTDVVFKTNGDQLKGEVIEVSDNEIRFKYTGEQAVYTLKKTDIQKITFASGRTETYNNIPQAGTDPSAPVKNPIAASSLVTPASAEDRRNKVAILPFSFVKDGQNVAQEASEEVQNQCFEMLRKHSGNYTVVSPRDVNVKLAKAGIDKSNMLRYSMGEICQLLGVEYIVDGVITQNTTSQSTTGNNSYDLKTKNDRKSGNDKVSGSGTYSKNVSQNYESVTDIKIYNDKNEMTYSQHKKALFSTVGAYKSSIEYLLKRSPLYTK